MARRGTYKHSQGAIAIAIFAFVLTAVPKINVRVGPVPMYFMDLLLIVVIYYAVRRPGFAGQARPFGTVVLVLFLLAIAGEMVGFIYTGSVFDHTYIIIRTVLAFLVFYATGQLIRSVEDLELVLKALALGLLVTSSLMILTSIPQTREPVAALILNNNFLDPAGTRISRFYIDTGDSGIRGRTLVGVSIMGASFINMIWPLVAILYVWRQPIGKWRNIAMIACFLAPMGVLMSYSRGPIIGSILIILATLLLGLHLIRKGVLRPLIAGVVVVLLVGVDSNAFFFDRLVNRTNAVLNNPFEDDRESERILAYVEPFEHVVERPEFLLLGQGNAIHRSRNVVPEMAGKASHALFAVAYYSHGMIAAFLYMGLLISMFYYTMRHMRFRQSGEGLYLSQALFASTLGLLPWALFGHAMVSTPRGAMMLFFLLGLMTTLRHFPLEASRPQAKKVENGYSRHIAV